MIVRHVAPCNFACNLCRNKIAKQVTLCHSALRFSDLILGFSDSILGFSDSILGFSDSILWFNDSILVCENVLFRALKMFYFFIGK